MATKKDLEKLLRTQYPDLNGEDLKEIIELVFNNITRELASGNRIELRGFGTFSVRDRAARIGRDPRKNEHIEIPARKAAYYRIAKGALRKLNPGIVLND